MSTAFFGDRLSLFAHVFYEPLMPSRSLTNVLFYDFFTGNFGSPKKSIRESDLELHILVRRILQAKEKNVRANRSRLPVRNRIRRWCSGHLFVCSCDPAARRWTQRKIKPNVDFFLLCLASQRDPPSALRSAPDSCICACADCLYQ